MTDLQMSKGSAIQRIRDLGVAYIGPEEWRTLNAHRCRRGDPRR
jgi:hypothetical protein